jgi:hypothetical protein
MKNDWLVILGWVVLILGILGFCLSWFVFFEVRKEGLANNSMVSFHLFLIENILCIGIGSYLIKNFSPEKKDLP